MTTTATLPLSAADYSWRAIKSGWRRLPVAGTVRQFSIDLAKAHSGRERVYVSIDADPLAPIAHWHTEPAKYGTRHHIHLRANAIDAVTLPAAKSSHRLLLAFGREVLRHEVQHGRYSLDSHGTLDGLKDAIRTAGVEFDLWNLLEDSRIEDAERTASGKGFGWTRFFNIADTAEPTQYFWNLKTVEAVYTGRLAKWTGPAKTLHPDTGKNWDTRDLIENFWERTCTAPSCADLIVIVQEWERVFGKSISKDIPTSSGNGYGGEGRAPAPVVVTPTVYTKDYAKVEGKKYGRRESPLTNYQSNYPHSDRETPEHAQKVRNIESTFSRIQSARDGARQRLATSGSRVHVGNAVAGEEQSFLRTTQRGGVRKLVLVLDMSSSMRSQYREHGAAFVEAVQNLRKRGLIHATILCTGGGKWATVPQGISTADLRRIEPDHGCESVKQTLDANAALLQTADTCLIYTDGNLTDGAVNAGHWRSQGVDLIGACCASEWNIDYIRPAMQEHFGRVITADSGHALAVAILDYLTRSH